MPLYQFNVKDLAPLVEHARASKEHQATWGMLENPAYLKEGEVMGERSYAEASQLDRTKIPAHLQLVKDSGVYMMSSGIPGLKEPGKESSKVVYANGYDQDTFEGGDDFVEVVDLAFVEKAIKANANNINVYVTANSIKMEFDTPKRERPMVNMGELKQAAQLAGATIRAKYAALGNTYKGAVYGYDPHYVFQKHGRGIVLHLKSDLAETPQKGKVLVITYGQDLEQKATVMDAAPKRTRKAGPDRSM